MPNLLARSLDSGWQSLWRGLSVVRRGPRHERALVVAISDSFTKQNAWARGIRRGQVEEAFAEPTGRTELPIGDGASITLVTKRMDRPRPHVILLIASQSPGRPLSVSSGYRLYGAEAELAALGSDPRRALDELIRRFGRDVTINGGAPTRFVEQLHLAAADFKLETGEGEFTVSSFVRRLAGGGWDVRYVWAIDEARYRSALSAN